MLRGREDNTFILTMYSFPQQKNNYQTEHIASKSRFSDGQIKLVRCFATAPIVNKS